MTRYFVIRSMAARIVLRAAMWVSVRALAVAERAPQLPRAAAVFPDRMAAGAGVAIHREVLAPVAGLRARLSDVAVAGAEVRADLGHRPAAGVVVAVELGPQCLGGLAIRRHQEHHGGGENEACTASNVHLILRSVEMG